MLELVTKSEGRGLAYHPQVKASTYDVYKVKQGGVPRIYSPTVGTLTYKYNISGSLEKSSKELSLY